MESFAFEVRIVVNDTNETIELTADIASAFVGNNRLPIGELPALIAEIYAALAQLGAPDAAPEPAPLVPAVSIKRSVTPDAIFSLEDGKPYKSLKRHLSTKYDMTPDQYRAKWGLPSDYPMVAPAYAEVRSAIAKSLGLGRKRGALAAKPSAQDAPALTPKPRGRPKTPAADV